MYKKVFLLFLITMLFFSYCMVGEVSAAEENEIWIFDYEGSIVEWVPPVQGLYRIEAWGASGGDDYAGSELRCGGLGAYMSGEIPLERSDVLIILVGEAGSKVGSWGAGGGGGTFVAFMDNIPLIIAGGGGGASRYDEKNNYYIDAVVGQSGAGRHNGVNYGGTNGQGGLTAQSITCGGAGGGFLSDGETCTNAYAGGGGGRSFLNGGGSGGIGAGFGGGGGGAYTSTKIPRPGGGGGYSGGGGDVGSGSGGGGSYNVLVNPSNQAGANSGNGMVKITLLEINDPTVMITNAMNAAYKATLAANTASTSADQAKTEATAAKQNTETIIDRLIGFSTKIEEILLTNTDLFWDSRKSATTNSEEHLNFSFADPVILYRYRVNNEAYSDWEPMANRVCVNLGAQNGIKNITVQFKLGELVIAKQAVIWKL